MRLKTYLDNRLATYGVALLVRPEQLVKLVIHGWSIIANDVTSSNDIYAQVLHSPTCVTKQPIAEISVYDLTSLVHCKVVGNRRMLCCTLSVGLFSNVIEISV